jgi:hypothetical protein
MVSLRSSREILNQMLMRSLRDVWMGPLTCSRLRITAAQLHQVEHSFTPQIHDYL